MRTTPKKLLFAIPAAAVVGWAYWCTRPFTHSGEMAFGVTVPVQVKPIIERDIRTGVLPITQGRDFNLKEYFGYLTFLSKPAVASPLALTFEGTPNQVTVGDGANRFEYVLQNGHWNLYRNNGGRLELHAANR